jgi:general secretion pathway protein J
LWAQNPGEAERLREVIIAPMTSWQIVYFRGGAWTNPLSSADQVSATPVTPSALGKVTSDAVMDAPKQEGAAAGGNGMMGTLIGGVPSAITPAAQAQTKTEALPDGVRLVLTLPDGGAVSGTLTRDWSRAGLGGS